MRRSRFFLKRGMGVSGVGYFCLLWGRGGGVAHGRYNNQWCLKIFNNFWNRYSHIIPFFINISLLLVCEFHQIDLPDGGRGPGPIDPHPLKTRTRMLVHVWFIINAIRDMYEIKSHSIIILECEMFSTVSCDTTKRAL